MERPAMDSIINHPSLGELVTDRLRMLIVSGELPAGQRLVETELSSRMGVSRGPVREAIARLEQEGFVQVLPRQGAYVLELTPETIHERYELRRLLEGYAVGHATRHHSPEDIELLGEHCRQTEQSVREQNLELFYTSQHRFHRHIVVMARMPMLLHLWDLLGSAMGSMILLNLCYANPGEAYSSRVWQSGTALGSVTAHLSLIEVISDSDAAAAVALMHEHLWSGERSVLRSLETARAVSSSQTRWSSTPVRRT